jgi:DnaJ-domain-containing protein 1
MGLGARLLNLLRAELNALADRAARRERAREEGGPDPLEDDAASHPPGWKREIAQHYANLELPYGANLATVKTQYRRLMGRYHPDRHHRDPQKAEVANRLAAELTRSYEALQRHLERR